MKTGVVFNFAAMDLDPICETCRLLVGTCRAILRAAALARGALP